MIWTTRNSWRAAATAIGALGLLIAVAAALGEPDVDVVTLDPPRVTQRAHGGRVALDTTGQVTCQSPQPLGTWSCQNGVWVAGPAPPSGPNGTGPGNCITPSPGAGWNCQNGTWLMTGADASNAARAPAPGNTQPGDPATDPARAIPCSPPSPAPGWTCQNGTWAAPSGSPLSTLPTTVPAPSNSCPGTSPAPTAVCQNGTWVIR